MVMQMVLSLLMPHEIHPVKKRNKTAVGVEMEKRAPAMCIPVIAMLTMEIWKFCS